MNNYKISIILPVFNVEKYIERALNSILNQTFNVDDIQVIMVDDCSTDRSVEIMDEYTKKYENFEVIHMEKNSGGSGIPKNIGIDHVKSDYIMFLDPDDEYLPDMCETLYNKIVESNADLVKCNNYFDTKYFRTKSFYYDENVIEARLSKKNRPLKFVTDWNGIHKTKIIKENNIRFPDVIGESFPFTLEEFFYLDKFIFLNNYFGHVYYRNDEVSHSRKPKIDKFYKCLESYYIANDIVLKHKRKDVIPELFGQQIMGLYIRALAIECSKEEKMKMIKEIYKIEKLLDSDLDIPKGRYRLAHKMISKKLFRTTYIYFKTLNNEIKSKPLKKILNFIVKNLLKIVKDKD